jgi:Leucine-rich repeat (LRR) protein
MARDEAYRIAEQKIDEARRSGAKELKLSGISDEKAPGLTTLPESLFQLTRLRRLDLARNKLTALPESLGRLTKLESLILAGNELTALPESLSQLTNLRRLNVDFNQLTSLPEWFGKLTQLRSLDLSHNKLTALPESLSQIAQMESLDLSYNQLTALPESIGHLRQLNSIDISVNRLTALPESMGQLARLTELRIGPNQISKLPDTLQGMTQLQTLFVWNNALTSLPAWIGSFRSLKTLGIPGNQLTELPEAVGDLSSLVELHLGETPGGNPFTGFPECIRKLKALLRLDVRSCNFNEVPDWLCELTKLEYLGLASNSLSDIPPSLASLDRLGQLELTYNPLNPELAVADREGLVAVKRYLRAKSEAQVQLNEAKLILIGEGEVGKSCLLGALRGDEWVDNRASTHGIEIKPVKVIYHEKGTEITLNGWDFGGQRVYRPTHQLFFSAPAVYLVVWKPREGSQAGAVKEWIRLVKHRAPDAKIFVVATHGGPRERQPDIDRQEFWDLFGKDTVVDFFHVDSQPPEKNETTRKRTGECAGIKELKDAIASVAAKLPELGRTVPKSWQEAREALKETKAPYLPLTDVLEVCRKHKMDEETAKLFVTISHRLGHLIHYDHDAALRDIVILKPDWLATAISFVLDDKQTRDGHGLVSSGRLRELWNDPEREETLRYPDTVHPVFVRLMERYDLSYVVTGMRPKGQADETSLIAQLVPDVRPEDDLKTTWATMAADGDEQQVQICRIVDDNGQSATAEGLFYQLIVRLHKFSLGRTDFEESVHWQRGLVLDDDYNGRALLEHIGNDVRITVRAAFPGAFLAVLTRDVKWLVESFWEGLRCEVVVPCVEPCGKKRPGTGVFEVQKLIAFKRQGMALFPCTVSGCDQAQEIDNLLRNAPAARRTSVETLINESFDELMSSVAAIRADLKTHDHKEVLRFQKLNQNDQRVLSQIDDAFADLLQALTDEAKEGPRLFSFEPVEPSFWDRPDWISAKYRVTLWCEHSLKPLSILNGGDDKRGVYDVSVPREWLTASAPFLKVLTGMLSLVLPVAASVTKFAMDETAYKGIEKQLDLGQKSLDAVMKGGEKSGIWLSKNSAPDLEHGTGTRAQGAALRQLHAWLKEKDPGFGGLIRVRNKRNEFLWVHPQFETEY